MSRAPCLIRTEPSRYRTPVTSETSSSPVRSSSRDIRVPSRPASPLTASRYRLLGHNASREPAEAQFCRVDIHNDCIKTGDDLPSLEKEYMTTAETRTSDMHELRPESHLRLSSAR